MKKLFLISLILVAGFSASAKGGGNGGHGKSAHFSINGKSKQFKEAAPKKLRVKQALKYQAGMPKVDFGSGETSIN
jgi:hypothetical protein